MLVAKCRLSVKPLTGNVKEDQDSCANRGGCGSRARRFRSQFYSACRIRTHSLQLLCEQFAGYGKRQGAVGTRVPQDHERCSDIAGYSTLHGTRSRRRIAGLPGRRHLHPRPLGPAADLFHWRATSLSAAALTRTFRTFGSGAPACCRLWTIGRYKPATCRRSRLRPKASRSDGGALIWCSVEPVARHRRTAPTLQQLN